LSERPRPTVHRPPPGHRRRSPCAGLRSAAPGRHLRPGRGRCLLRPAPHV